MAHRFHNQHGPSGAPPLRKWQKTALEAWVHAGHRGIVAAATGTGKTRFALEALSTVNADKVVVVVPTSSLQEQWIKELRTGLGLSRRMIGSIGGRSPSFRFENDVTVAVINSARQRLAGVIEHWHSEGHSVLLIVDECHWAGSESSSGLFRITPKFTLGLSATPERSDEGFEELMVPNLGDVVFRYPLRKAIDERVLSDIVSTHWQFALTKSEQRETDRLTHKIQSLRAELSERHSQLTAGPGWEQRLSRLAESEHSARQLQRLLDERRSDVSAASGRISCFVAMVLSGYLEHRLTLVFNETIAQASAIATELRRLGQPFALEHSQLPDTERKSALDRFASNSVPMLVAVRALDEGIDVPEANTAVIVSGSLNTRQRVQRIGRIARASETSAEVISIIARNSAEETETMLLDFELLGSHRVRRLDIEAFRS